jgi:type IX secretion system PorP/SprF family membrane protein
MSRPSFENIDQWLFEYTEGSLSVVQESQLMDFIKLNPEVMTDLKAWNQAKATPKSTPEFSTAALIKSAPILLRPIPLMTLGVLAILLGWFGFNNFPASPIYSEAVIDAQIIYVGDEDKLEENILLANTLKESQTENEGQTENKIEKQGAIANIKSTATSPNLAQQNTISSDNQNIGFSEIISNEENTAFSNTSEKVEIDYPELRQIQNNFEAKANDLDDISAYLNRSSETEKDIDNNSKRIISSTDVAEVSLKKTLSNAYRKIKRMADQPVALRNTKNPHYHAPMMTGYKANIAMVGSAPGNRIQATSRIQWLEEKNTQLMNTLSWDGYVYALRGGLGVDINYNGYKIDALKNYSVGLTYSPKFSINKKISFEPALRFKMGVINIDQSADLIGSKVEIDRHNIVPLFENEQNVSGSQLWYRDVGLGFMLNTEWFYAGFNADNLGRHNNNFFTSDLSQEHRENIYYTAVIGTEYQSITRDIKVSGYGLFQSYGDLNELWMGGNFQYKWLQAGAGLSTNADFGASLGTVFNRFSFHYNADYLNSRLLNGRHLSHQVTMKILLKPSRYAAKFLNL